MGDDVELAVAPIGLDGRGLIARLGVVGDEAREKLLHCGCPARGALLCTRILAFADIGQPILGDGSGLLNRDLAKAADGWFATLTVVGDIGDHEDLAAGRRDLEHEPRYRCVAEFVSVLFWPSGVDDGLREFESWHSYPPTKPDLRCEIGAARNPTVAYDRLGFDHHTN
jgi:hypothetical protein